jgi:hypothetical protein
VVAQNQDLLRPLGSLKHETTTTLLHRRVISVRKSQDVALNFVSQALLVVCDMSK